MPSKRIGRPPKSPEDKSDKRPFSVRLSPAHIVKLKALGVPALEAWIQRAKVKK